MSELTDKIEELERLSVAIWNITYTAQALQLTKDDIADDHGYGSVIIKLLQELADRRAKDKLCFLPNGVTAEGSYLGVADVQKPSTYDERDMMAEHGAWFGKEHPGDTQKEKVDSEWQDALDKARMRAVERGSLFTKLLMEMTQLGLLSSDATDPVAFVAIRDILNAHAQDKSYDARYGAKTATNASKEQGRAYETPSDKV